MWSTGLVMRHCATCRPTVASTVTQRTCVLARAVLQGWPAGAQRQLERPEVIPTDNQPSFGLFAASQTASLVRGFSADTAEVSLQSLEAALGPVQSGPMVPPPKPVVVVISGPSGVGKDSVVARLKEHRQDLYFVVTATSRGQRPLELEGRDYFFVSRDKFEGWIQGDMLLEHALVYGDYKGIPRQQVDDALHSGTDVVLRIDVQGAATVKRLIPDAITIFVAAETESILVQRLAARKTETLEQLAVRVATARAEVARLHEFDYVVVNGSGALEACVAEVSAIIDAEKAKTKNRAWDAAPVALQS
eukprot:CAMPEP_0119101324 /NCGR_PEP_ID=MMETSP1180-20130426/408_1 /TAXON_ID=3052 ORGANISM="Chlamydomonas cf sp, Strain CCMP681" /NCGR_SAMPLE_ID=MMETSP1180 /ASSEMBLY_ACC=CAM_ASM_000741 /LENGTH=304 /DNA_ID=CAMNT_0007085433 /DNA_START=62 /DNA_END=976 /DNA_ORIENTATION=+